MARKKQAPKKQAPKKVAPKKAAPKKAAQAIMPAPLPPAPPPPAPPPRTPRLEVIEGWAIQVRHFAEVALADEALKLLGYHLYEIRRRVPASAVRKLQRVPLVLSERNITRATWAGYHPEESLVEISRAQEFLALTVQQPYTVLHELAHAYHHQFLPLGFQNDIVRETWQSAKAARRYEQVLHINGATVLTGHAAKDPMEYFAELTEAFFGSNDMYPFVRAELQRHDPNGYGLVAWAWGLP